MVKWAQGRHKPNISYGQALSKQDIPTVAVFDFDRTITDRHTFWRFLLFVAGPFRFGLSLFLLSFSILKTLFGLMPVLKLRELAIHHFLSGFAEEEFQALCEQFAKRKIPNWIRKKAMKRIHWHQKLGHQTVLVSNAPAAYLVLWATNVGFNDVIGSEFEVKNGVLTGRLQGAHCAGVEKVIRLRHLLGPLSRCLIHAYGDCEADRQMLRIADYPYYRTFSRPDTLGSSDMC